MRNTSKPRGLSLWLVAAAASCAAVPSAAQACRVRAPPTLEDVRYADVVVMGRIANYRIVRDEAFRRRMLASPRLSPEERRRYRDPRQGFMSDYARFEILVDEALVGRAPRRLSVTWDNSTFGEPERLAPGPYLIALRRPASPRPPLRGPSATIGPNPDRNALTLLQAPCSNPFLYEAGSAQARTIRRLLGRR